MMAKCNQWNFCLLSESLGNSSDLGSSVSLSNCLKQEESYDVFYFFPLIVTWEIGKPALNVVLPQTVPLQMPDLWPPAPEILATSSCTCDKWLVLSFFILLSLNQPSRPTPAHLWSGCKVSRDCWTLSPDSHVTLGDQHSQCRPPWP